jgi:heptosyltransferase III
MKKILANSWLQLLKIQNSSKPLKPFEKSKIKNILFIELSRLGDVVSLLPTIRCFEKKFPEVKLQFAIDSRYSSVIRTFAPSSVIYPLTKTDSFAGILSAVQGLLEKQFDLICSMSPSLRNAFLSFRLKGTYKVGFFESYSSYTPFLHRNHVKSYGISKARSQTFYYENIEERGLKICKLLGIKSSIKSVKVSSFKLPEINSTEIATFMRSRYFVIHPFSGWKFRNWKADRYLELSKQLLDKTDLNLVLIGSEGEKKEGEKLMSAIKRPGRVMSVFDRNLGDMITVIAKAELFIGNDSGPLHLASALSIPSIGLFGPATPSLTAPKRKKNFYFHKKVECCPCDQTKCIRPENPCIDLIPVSEVVKKSLDYIK